MKTTVAALAGVVVGAFALAVFALKLTGKI
jgi:hypothetical protein